jgi:hypothetical protein
MADPEDPKPSVPAAVVRSAVAEAADKALDAVERLLFGKVGGAEEAVRRESDVDALERARARLGAETPPAGPSRREAAAEAARLELEELKRQRALRENPPEVKKTL